MLNKVGRKLFGFNINKKVVKDFSLICKNKGLRGNRQIEIMMEKFIKERDKHV